RWMYVGWNPVIEFSSNAGGTSLTRKLEFTWGSDLSGSMEGAGGVGGLLMQRTVSDGKLRRPAYDGNGNITAWALKGSEGTANPNMEQLRTEYDAFGNIVVSEGILNSEFGFSTKIRDPYTGLSYYGYRYYDPVTGRWPSRDPIGERGWANLYGFVGNNGVSGIDPIGLTEIDLNQPNEEKNQIKNFGIPLQIKID
ncbi:RHS repeat-associated protein, partial [Haloferula luteola]